MIQTGADSCREALTAAAWTIRWSDAEPKLREARDALARELGAYLGVPMDEDTEIVHTAMQEALQLVLRALSTGIQHEQAGTSSQLEVRRLVAEAIATLDEVL